MNTRTQRYKNLDKEINEQLKYKKIEKRKKKIRKLLIIIFLIIILVILYARFVEPYLLKTNEIKITSNEITDSFKGLKIVHISDIHYGTVVKDKILKKIVTEINILKPDIVIFTGDLIDDKYKENKNDLSIIIKYLKNINSTYGKYAVIGNHDYYNTNYKNIIYDSGFILLNNNYDIIYNEKNESIGIYGFDDILYGTPTLDLLNDEKYKNTNYKIVILHEPDYIDNIIYDYKVNLILAGHSHNRQVNIPFIKAFWLPQGAKTYYDNYYNINDVDIYISNGIGTSFLKFRLFSIPSINFYRITKP